MTPAFRCAAALLCALLSTALPRAARAEPPSSRAVPVYVLSIWTDDADDQADALTQALRGRVRQAQGWSLLETTQSFETLSIALKCPQKPDPSCLQRIGDQLKADHYVWGTMERKRGPQGHVNADIHMWTRTKPDTTAHESFVDTLKDPNDESLRTIAAGLFAKVVGAPQPAAAVSADAEPAATAPFGEQQALAVGVSPVPEGPSSPGSNRIPTRTILAYSAVVLGSGLLVASVIEAANWIGDNNRSSDDRKLVPKTVTDVCAEQFNPSAKDACSAGKDAVTASTLGWLFAGVGAVLVGTGVWLVTAEDGSRRSSRSANWHAPPEHRFKVLPSLGLRQTSVAVRVTF